MTRNLESYTVIDGKEQLVQDENGDIWAGEWQRTQRVRARDNDMVALGTYNDPFRGDDQVAQLTKPSLLRHMLIMGNTGYGKETAIRNLQVQLIQDGHGMCFVDPRGSAKKLLKSIPEERHDDVIYIEPASGNEKAVGMNILEPGLDPSDNQYEAEVDHIAASITGMLKDRSEFWGPQIGNLIETLLKQLIRVDEPYTLLDFVTILHDKEERQRFAEVHGDELGDTKFLERIAEQDNAAFDPILRRVRGWVEDRTTHQALVQENSPFNFVDATREDKIVIIDTSNIQRQATKELVTRAFVESLWSAMKIFERPRDKSYYLFIDECDRVLSETWDINSIIAQARSFKLGVILTCQHISQLPDDAATGCRQVEHKLLFNPGPNPSEAASAAQFHSINQNKLTELDRFKAITRVMSEDGYKSDEAVEVELFAELPPETADPSTVIDHSNDTYAAELSINFDLDNYGVRE